MSFYFDDFAARLKAGASINEADTMALRREVWRDGILSADEADALFRLNSDAKSVDPAWVDFFVEAIGDYLVQQLAPVGYIDNDNAAWLIAQIDVDGRVDTMAEMELLVKLAERAVNMPDSLKDYSLAQIEQLVLTGAGPTRSGQNLTPGRIDAVEVKLLRRLLFAPGSHGPASISGEEAALLFRVKDATLGADNAPEWKQLFVQGVANHLFAFSAYRPMSIDRARELDQFMRTPGSGTGGILAGLGRGLDARGALAAVFGEDEQAKIAAREAGAVEAGRLDAPEMAWVLARLNADGRRDPLEEALLDFIQEETGMRPV